RRAARGRGRVRGRAGHRSRDTPNRPTCVRSTERRGIMTPTSSARTTPTPTSPPARPSWAVPVEDLQATLATDHDTVDTAALPRLAFRDAVEESATTSDAPVSAVAETTEGVSDATPVAEPAAPPVGHSLRRRHASPESLVAIRRNLVAVACVIVTVVLLGAAAGW